MKKVLALVVMAAMLMVIVPSIASAEVINGDYTISSPGTYTNLVVTGTLYITCDGVTLVGVTAAGVSITASDAIVVIGDGCVIDALEISSLATGVSLEISGVVKDLSVQGQAADVALVGAADIGKITIPANVAGTSISMVRGVEVDAIVNNSTSTGIDAPSGVVDDDAFQGDVAVNFVYN